MSQADIEVIREQYAAVNEGDFKHAMDLYADDVVLVVPAADGVMNPGTFEGKEAVGEWFGDWFRTFARGYRFEIVEIEDLGPEIFLHTTHHGHGRLSGVEVQDENGYLYRVRDGRIARVEFYATPGEARAAAGRTPEAG